MKSRILVVLAVLLGAVSLLGLIPSALLALPLMVGAVATYTPSTSGTDLNTVWRKVQTPLQIGAQFATDEWDMLDDVPNMNIDLSARSIDMPVDLIEEVGIASIPEGGYEARPSSTKPVDGSLTWIFLNGRITLSRTAEILDNLPAGKRAMIARQLMYQGQKKLQAMQRKIGDFFYGKSDAVMAKVSSGTTDIVVKDMYGVSGLGAAGESREVIDLFRANEFVAILNPTGPAIRASGIQKITARDIAALEITLAADVAAAAADDLIVGANSLENDTATLSSTDHNKGFVGLLDVAESTTVHGISSGTNPEWDVAHEDTAGGRMTGVKLRRGAQQIRNKGGVDPDSVIWPQGVENDVLALYQASLRYSDAFSLQMDGQPKFRGIRFISSRFCPGKRVWMFNKSKLKKLNLVRKPDAGLAWGDGHKLTDQSGYVFPFDFPVALVCTNRRAFAYWTAVTEQN